MRIEKSEIPANSLIGQYLPANYRDTYRCEIPFGATYTADDIQVFFWTAKPKWIDALFRIRNILVKPFGLNTDRENNRDFEHNLRAGKSYGKMSILSRNERETVLALNDSHLRADMSIMIEESLGNNTKFVYITTLVHFHNWLGRMYFRIIRPFHHLVVKGMLKFTLKNLN